MTDKQQDLASPPAHTAGPWEVVKTERQNVPGSYWREISHGGGYEQTTVIAEVFSDTYSEPQEPTEDEAEANAHLIAASPMLFEAALDAVEALKLLRVGLRGDASGREVIDAHIDELQYAITKARGQS